MNTFKITQVLDSNTVRCSPNWKMKMKDGSEITGNRVMIRGLEADRQKDKNQIILDRLKKLLLQDKQEIRFNAPELVDSSNPNDPVVSCSLYVSKTNILYYFPEFVYKDDWD